MSDTSESTTETKPKAAKQAVAPQQVYMVNLDDRSVSVEATSVEEAVAKANKVTNNVKDGDA